MKSNNIFGTDGIRGKYETSYITAEGFCHIVQTIANFMKKNSKIDSNLFAVCRDTRFSSSKLALGVFHGLKLAGMEGIDLGILPTPAVAAFIKKNNCVGGIMITASHNPAEDNGLKIITHDGTKLDFKDSQKIENFIRKTDVNNKIKFQPLDHDIVPNDFYNEHITDHIKYISEEKLPLSGLKIVIDGANGAGFKVGEQILSSLGANTIAVGNRPDGYNINSNCGAIHPDYISLATKQVNADFGVAVDGDADRIIISDRNGKILSGEHCIAILCKYTTNRINNRRVVLSHDYNLGLGKFLDQINVKIDVTPNGDILIHKKMIENDAWLGGEPSGHIILKEVSPISDGILIGSLVLYLIKKEGIDKPDAIYNPYPQVKLDVLFEASKLTNDIKTHINNKIKPLLNQYNNDKTRLICRYSGTESKIRINCQDKDVDVAIKIADEVAERVRSLLNK